MPFDAFNRDISYLRISLTDACNLRCVYCMPEHMTFRPREELLSDQELRRLITLFGATGFRKIRFTGGEPTLRPGLVDLVRHAYATPGIEAVGLTTNGVLLDHLAGPLRAAGLRSVNISLDSLNDVTFRRLTRWGSLRDVRAGLEAAAGAGLRVKLNAVVCRGINDGEDVVELARLTVAQDWQVRFIEQMPFGNNANFQTQSIVTEDELLGRLGAEFGPLELLSGGELDGEARMYRIRGARGSVGFISPVTQPFCAGCNRMRLTAEGVLRLCLLRDSEVDLRPVLRDGGGDDDLRDLILHAVREKPWGHGLAHQLIPSARGMSQIGG
ncbi:MAG TPA: GTP 3',8-cyclase MoaA [Candidatus Didemnitutus sp.]|nr:GTP 3',8-cyclase MoaA [Candidatus Didemnitutus sp.]